MTPFVVEGLPRFPDCGALRPLLRRVDEDHLVLAAGYLCHHASGYPVVRAFLERLPVKPYAAFLSRADAGVRLSLHRDERSRVKLHFPLEVDDCRVLFYPPEGGREPVAEHRYRREEPVLLDVQVPHELENRSAAHKYALILSWDGLGLDEAAAMLRGLARPG